MDRKTEFKFEGIDPLTNKRFKILLEGWVPDDLIGLVQEQITRIKGQRNPAIFCHNCGPASNSEFEFRDRGIREKIGGGNQRISTGSTSTIMLYSRNWEDPVSRNPL